MKLLPVLASSAWLLALLPAPLYGSGDYWLTPTYLDSATKMMETAPEFFWHEEVQRLAEKYRDREAADMQIKGAAEADGFISREANFSGAKREPGTRAVTTPDLEDFAEALKTGRLKPADAAAATEAHRKARAAIDAGGPLPEGEADSEFADYHAGAAAKEIPAANAAWEKLLARPKEERHYRSVWAAFMLGKNALKEKKWPEAVSHFQRCRALAREGFADSCSLAADSYGWEGRAELMQKHYPQAARVYLTQLALGDFSAVVSLKLCVPAHYWPDGAGDRPGAQETGDHWLEAARDPVLQELMTARILSTGESGDEFYLRQGWLETLAKAGVATVEDAARVAWVAYHAGDYKTARAWLAKAKTATPVSRWLEARFAARDGKSEAAARIMKGVTKEFPDTGPMIHNVPMHDRAHGERGMILYGEGKFLEAFEEFRKGNCDKDTQFMIESVLTYQEMKAVLAKIAQPEVAAGTTEERWTEIRRQIARRFVRDGRVKESRALFPEYERQIMDDYIALAVSADNKKASAEERAQAHWNAGVLMLGQGHQFRGTREDFHRPQNWNPAFHPLRAQRVAGSYEFTPDPGWPDKKTRKRVSIRASTGERKRLAATARHHAKPMRTRMVAVNHLLQGAALLPDKSEVAARLLNIAGYWLQDLDNAAADRIYYRIERDFAGTPTGKAVIAKHWFTGDGGPWDESGFVPVEER